MCDVHAVTARLKITMHLRQDRGLVQKENSQEIIGLARLHGTVFPLTGLQKGLNYPLATN